MIWRCATTGMDRRKAAGVTLIEVVIVTALLALLVAVAGVTIVQGQKVAGQSVVVSDIQNNLNAVLQKLIREVSKSSVSGAATEPAVRLLGSAGDYDGIAFKKVVDVTDAGDLVFDTGDVGSPLYYHYVLDAENGLIEWYTSTAIEGAPIDPPGRLTIAASVKDLTFAWADDANTAVYQTSRRILIEIVGDRILNDGTVYEATLSSSVFLRN